MRLGGFWMGTVRKAAAAACLLAVTAMYGQLQAPPRAKAAWDDKSLSPDERADLVIAQMTLDE